MILSIQTGANSFYQMTQGAEKYQIFSFHMAVS